MTTISPTAGALQMAAALAFHLPGARLDLSGADGAKCSVGPLTDPRCMLHPAEFRDLVVTSGDVMDFVATVPGNPFGGDPSLSLTTDMAGVEHIGSGLYRIVGRDITTYAFVTPLPAGVVDAVMSQMKAEVPVEYEQCKTAAPAQSGSTPRGDETIVVNLIHDEGLGVTMVVMCNSDSIDVLGEEIARGAVSACLVAEMEHVLRSVG